MGMSNFTKALDKLKFWPEGDPGSKSQRVRQIYSNLCWGVMNVCTEMKWYFIVCCNLQWFILVLKAYSEHEDILLRLPPFLPHCKLSRSVSVTDVYRFTSLIQQLSSGMTTSIHTFSILLSSILHHHLPLSFSVLSLPLALLLPLLLLQPTVWVSSGVQSTVLHWSVKSDLVWLCFCPLPKRLASTLSDTAEGIWGGVLSRTAWGEKTCVCRRSGLVLGQLWCSCGLGDLSGTTSVCIRLAADTVQLNHSFQFRFCLCFSRIMLLLYDVVTSISVFSDDYRLFIVFFWLHISVRFISSGWFLTARLVKCTNLLICIANYYQQGEAYTTFSQRLLSFS